MDDYSPLDNDELSEYDIYGKTPPRTKILRKNRERKQRDKQTGPAMSSPKIVRTKTPLSRRNTVSAMYDELIARAENGEDQGTKRTNKRQMKLLRGSERDLKLDIASAQAVTAAEKAPDQPQEFEYPRTPGYQIESCNRFMSLSCRTVACSRQAGGHLKSSDVLGEESGASSAGDECPASRVEFYHTLKALIRMGCGDKQVQDRNPRRADMYLVVTENIHLILLATLAVLIYVYFKRAHSFWRRMGVPQLNPTFPFGDVASVVLRRQNMAEKVKEVYDRMKGQKCVGMYFFSRPTFLPLDPVLIKDIQSTDFEHFYDRGIYYDEENDPISAHLFSIAGPKWKRLRAKMTPAFSPGKLKYMFDTIAQCGHQMIDLLKQLTSEERGAVEIKEILARYTTDVIGCCAFGLECNCMRNPQAEFRMMGKRAFTQTIGDLLKMIVIRSFPSLARLLRIGVFSRTVTNFFYRVVKETIEYREKNNVTRNDFLQLLIQLRKDGQLDDNQNSENAKVPGVTGLTMEEAAAQAFIFFLAGFETTSTTISFALFEMATNEDIQLKARKEVVKVFKTFGGLSYESVMEMHYLDTIIFETLRKYPPAPAFLRKCTKTYQIPGTTSFIKEGLSVIIPCYGLHRDPEYFPEPERFDPDRFNEENRSKIWDYTYIPFGDGPRNCIGMRFAMIQAKIALSLMLSNFNFNLNKRTKLPLKMEIAGILLSPIGGLWLDLQPISS